MSDPRDDLAALIVRESSLWNGYELADAILSRWRLVPVEEEIACNGVHPHETYTLMPGVPHPPMCTRTGQRTNRNTHAITGADQHRAADELTQHDQAAGIYDDNCKPCTDLRTAMLDLHQRGFSDRQIAERLGMSTRTIANRRRKMGLQYNDGKAIRTDQHGPHED